MPYLLLVSLFVLIPTYVLAQSSGFESALVIELKEAEKNIKRINKKKAELSKHLKEITKEIKALEKNEASQRKSLKDDVNNYYHSISNLAKLERFPQQALVVTDTLNNNPHRTNVLRISRQFLQSNMQNSGSELQTIMVTRATQKATAAQVTSFQAKLNGYEKDLRAMYKLKTKLKTLSESKQKRLLRKAKNLNSAANLNALFDSVDPTKSLSKLPDLQRGLDKLPVKGKVLTTYKELDPLGIESKGITIATIAGATVIALQTGKVIYSGSFRGYGELLILEHAKNYHSVYSGLSEARRRVGSFIKQGEPVGFMPADNNPELYFELRNDGQATNPRTWLTSKK